MADPMDGDPSSATSGASEMEVWYQLFGARPSCVKVEADSNVEGLLRAILAKRVDLLQVVDKYVVYSDGNKLKRSNQIEENDEDTAYEIIPIPASGDGTDLFLRKLRRFSLKDPGKLPLYLECIKAEPGIVSNYPRRPYADLVKELDHKVTTLPAWTRLKAMMSRVSYDPAARLGAFEEWATKGNCIPLEELRPQLVMPFKYQPRHRFTMDLLAKEPSEDVEGAEDFVYDEFSGRFGNYIRHNFGRQSHMHLACVAPSGMGKTRFGIEIFDQMKKRAEKEAAEYAEIMIVTKFSAALASAQHIFVEFNASGNKYDEESEAGMTTSGNAAALMGLRIFLAGRCNLTIRDVRNMIIEKGSLKELMNLMGESLVPKNLFPYMAMRWREQNGFDKDDLVMFYLHVDEYQLPPADVMHDMLGPIVEYVATGYQSRARKDGVFIAMLMTGTLSSKIGKITEDSMTQRGCTLVTLKSMSLNTMMDIMLNDPQSELSNLSKENKAILAENKLFQVFVEDLGGIPRYLEACLYGSRTELRKFQESMMKKTIDDSDVKHLLNDLLAPRVKSRVNIYVTGAQQNYKVDFAPWVDLIIAGVRPPADDRKIGNTTVKELQEAGFVQISRDGEIYVPTVLLIYMAHAIKSSEAKSSGGPVKSLPDYLPFPLLKTYDDRLENVIVHVEGARQRALRLALGNNDAETKKLTISKLFPGAEGDESVLQDKVIFPAELKIKIDSSNYGVLDVDVTNVEKVDELSQTIWKTEESAQGFGAFRVLRRTNGGKPYLVLYQFKGAKKFRDEEMSKQRDRFVGEFLKMAAEVFYNNRATFSKYELVYLYVDLHRMEFEPNEYADLVVKSFTTGEEEEELKDPKPDPPDPYPKLLIVSKNGLNDFLPHLAHRLEGYFKYNAASSASSSSSSSTSEAASQAPLSAASQSDE